MHMYLPELWVQPMECAHCHKPLGVVACVTEQDQKKMEEHIFSIMCHACYTDWEQHAREYNAKVSIVD